MRRERNAAVRGPCRARARPASRAGDLITIYETLLAAHGPQGWWPVTPPRGLRPRYSGGPRTERQRFEVAAGAVLTQNTVWVNAARAIESLNRARLMSAEAIAATDVSLLASFIRSSGYFNQKARRLRALAEFLLVRPRPTREELLALCGIGPETADSIMLYALGEPFFVVDAYTRRVFSRIGLIEEGAPYEEIRALFERNLPREARLYNEYHALIVKHSKLSCRRKPLCKACAIEEFCDSARREREERKRPNKK